MNYTKDEIVSLLESILHELGAAEKNDEMSVAARFIGVDRSELRRVDVTAEKSSAVDTAYFLMEEAKDWDINTHPLPGDDAGVIVKKIAGKKVPFYCMASVDTGDRKFVIFFENELPYIEDMHIIHAEADTAFVEEYVRRVTERAESDTVWRGHTVAIDNDGAIEEIDEVFNVSMDDLVLTDDRREQIINAVESTDGDVAEKLESAGISASRGVIVYGPKGTGKALANGTPVLTPTGWVNIEDLAIGDNAIGSDGAPVSVLGVYPQGERELYTVSFSDGASVTCDSEHLWSHYVEGELVTRTAKDLADNGIPDDYVFPFALGAEHSQLPGEYDMYDIGASLARANVEIPADYFTCSYADRADIIRGIIGIAPASSDLPMRNLFDSEGFANSVRDMLWSLGYQTNVSRDTDNENAFVLSVNDPRHQRRIVSITPAGVGEATCIKVDAGDELFVTKDYVLTHNTTISRAIITAVQGERTVIVSQPGGIVRAFQLARRSGPTVIILDDIDISVGNRERGNHTGLLTAMLTEMDGPVQNGRILTYATANVIGNIDTALLRSGRFDTKIELDRMPVSVLKDMAEDMAGKLSIDVSDIDDEWFENKTPAEVVDEVKSRVTNKARGTVGESQKKQFGFR